MKSYKELLCKVLMEGHSKPDRTGIGTMSLFGETWEHDLQDGFPLLTTKKVRFSSVVSELLWFLEGSTNAKRLNELGSKIWDRWADEDGELGPIYGHQWRKAAGSIDQLANAIDLLENDPTSRRIVVCSWQVADIPEMAIPPCHCLFQFYVRPHRELRMKRAPHLNFLDIRIDQRSCDLPIGAPYNMASYAILNHMVAAYLGIRPGRVIFHYGDVHIYNDQIDLVFEQLNREPKPLPTLHVEPVEGKPIWEWGPDCLRLEGYEHHPHIPYPVAV